jgi:hypothetical protein
VTPADIAATQHAWREGRCACCYKKTEIVLGPVCNETARGWDNFLGRAEAAQLAKDGTCPWCGRRTTIVARILMQRFESRLRRYERDLFA